MKKVIFFASLSFVSIYSIAQLKVESSGQVSVSNKEVITIGTGTNFDALDIVNNSTNLTSGTDLIWGNYPNYEYYDVGLVRLSYQNTTKFIVKKSGKVGINNSSPAYNLDVVGNGHFTGALTWGSDERLKDKVSSLSDVKSLLLKLNAIKYTYKTTPELFAYNSGVLKDTYKDGVKMNIYEPDLEYYKTIHFGFIAQDVEKLFPDLVYKDSCGLLSLDYIGIIPLLVESLKEQDKQITEQNGKIATLESRVLGLEKTISNGNEKKDALLPSNSKSNNQDLPSLSQNTPNPFNQKTEIGYFLPESSSNAMINIYNMSGRPVKSINIPKSGQGSIIINGSELLPGMYLYTLITNEVEVDTKRMILTE